jgi:Icc-related predicted phosphoesterase
MHGNLPTLPDCDAVLISGDICIRASAAKQLIWLDHMFRAWLKKINKPVFACAGNHDWAMFERLHDMRKLRLPCTYLQDNSAVFEGFHVYGTPWQKRFYDWAFNLDESALAGKWNVIPENTDILICHSPPKYYGDKTSNGQFVGSESLTWRIGQIKPKLVVFGHIHGGYGEYRSSDTILVNAALTDDHYKPVNKLIVVELPNKTN